jgi:hypothetical protein
MTREIARPDASAGAIAAEVERLRSLLRSRKHSDGERAWIAAAIGKLKADAAEAEREAKARKAQAKRPGPSEAV